MRVAEMARAEARAEAAREAERTERADRAFEAEMAHHAFMEAMTPEEREAYHRMIMEE